MQIKKSSFQIYDEREAVVISVWRKSGLTDGSITQYLQWVRRYRDYCKRVGRDEIQYCTLKNALAFGVSCRAKHRRGFIGVDSRELIQSALRAWRCALQSLGYPTPDWKSVPPKNRQPSLIVEYSKYRVLHRGVAPATLARDVQIVSEFIDLLQSRNKSIRSAQISDLDAFVERMSKRHTPRIVATDCSTLRCFLRFLQTTGRLRRDLAGALLSPRIGVQTTPPRALPWEDVRRIINAIPRGTRVGRRDYAMLLMMATYGMGAAEVITMHLEDISWEKQLFKILRPKTGNLIELPLLPAVAKAIANYLNNGRPNHSLAREVFLTKGMPHKKISSSVLRHQIRHYASIAGLNYEILGSHLFRHSHATRQINQSVSQKIVSDILGHRRPSSTSVYIRVALHRLRLVSLPVPR
jgi:site-specific recombinase XerD